MIQHVPIIKFTFKAMRSGAMILEILVKMQ